MSTPVKQRTRISLEDKVKLIEDSKNITFCLSYKARISINVLLIYHIASIHEGKKPFDVKFAKGLKI